MRYTHRYKNNLSMPCNQGPLRDSGVPALSRARSTESCDCLTAQDVWSERAPERIASEWSSDTIPSIKSLY